MEGNIFGHWHSLINNEVANMGSHAFDSLIYAQDFFFLGGLLGSKIAHSQTHALCESFAWHPPRDGGRGRVFLNLLDELYTGVGQNEAVTIVEEVADLEGVYGIISHGHGLFVDLFGCVS